MVNCQASSICTVPAEAAVSPSPWLHQSTEGVKGDSSIYLTKQRGEEKGKRREVYHSNAKGFVPSKFHWFTCGLGEMHGSS